MSWVCLKDETRKVRKHYRCTWCGEEICPGDAYQYSRGVFEGSMCTNRLHPECDKAAQEDFREWGEGFAPREYAAGNCSHVSGAAMKKQPRKSAHLPRRYIFEEDGDEPVSGWILAAWTAAGIGSWILVWWVCW